MLSAFDTDDNLRRAIPLQVFDFIGKPLPERHGFEARIPEWVERTRTRRRSHALASNAELLCKDLGSARLEKEIELVASETARDALLQTAGFLTTIHAHLVTAGAFLSTRSRTDPAFSNVVRNLDEARKTADAAVTVAERFFGSAYGSRDSSPALVDAGIRHAIDIGTRMCAVEMANQTVDFAPLDERTIIQSLSGIDFLLMMVPAIGVALRFAAKNTTVGIRVEPLGRLEAVMKDSRYREYLWVNRRHAVSSQAGVLITLSVAAPPFSRALAEAWLNGENAPLASVSARGLTAGLQKCRGFLAMSLSPDDEHFRLLLALPT